MSANSKPRATTWVKPGQVASLRTAVYQCRPDYLQQRDDAVITLMYDTGLRVGELVALDVDHLRDDNTTLYLPAGLQKDYPNDNTPEPARLGLDDDTTRTLAAYLANRWKDTPALFPSRSSPRLSTQAVRDMVATVAEAAEVRPFMRDGSRGEPADLTPHTLRHGVAYRMMNAEEGNKLYDVRTRLRHRSLTTTERVYDHLIER